VRSDLLAVVRQTVQPDVAGLWLRVPAAAPLRTGRAAAEVVT
jgi:hypothetical protein